MEVAAVLGVVLVSGQPGAGGCGGGIDERPRYGVLSVLHKGLRSGRSPRGGWLRWFRVEERPSATG